MKKSPIRRNKMTGTYEPIVKTLKKVKGTQRDDGIVTRIEIEVVYAFEGDEVNPPWKTSYSHNEDVEYLGKTVDQFTKSELIALMPSNIEGHIFHAHYEAHNTPPKDNSASFDIVNMPE